MIKTRRSLRTVYLRTPWGPFSTKFKATANDLGQERTQLKCYKVFMLSGTKIC